MIIILERGVITISIAIINSAGQNMAKSSKPAIPWYKPCILPTEMLDSVDKRDVFLSPECLKILNWSRLKRLGDEKLIVSKMVRFVCYRTGKKLLDYSIFSFSHDVYKRPLLQDCAEPHSSAGSAHDLRTEGRWFDPLGRLTFFLIDVSHCDRIHSFLTHSFDNGYELMTESSQ